MLVLGRKTDQPIVIQTSDGPIVITPVMIRGDQVRLGIDAPKSVGIYRRELCDDNLQPIPKREAA